MSLVITKQTDTATVTEGEYPEIEAWTHRHLDEAVVFANRRSLLHYAVAIADPSGLFCEFGVAHGESIRSLAEWCPDVHFHGFDTFTGLPEDGGRRQWPKGQFTNGGRIPSIAENVTFYKGLFQDTIPEFLAEHKGAASFLHIDCDIYSSTKTVLDSMRERIVPGTIMKFDEFWKFADWQILSEARAMFEFCRDNDIEVECLGVEDEKAILRVL